MAFGRAVQRQQRERVERAARTPAQVMFDSVIERIPITMRQGSVLNEIAAVRALLNGVSAETLQEFKAKAEGLEKLLSTADHAVANAIKRATTAEQRIVELEIKMAELTAGTGS